MTILKLLISFAAVTVALFSGHARTTPTHSGETWFPFPSRRQAPARDLSSVNPLEIKRLIDESKRQWKKSGVVQDVDLVPAWKKLGIEDRYLESCGGGSCEVELGKTNLDEQSPDEIILRINDSNFCRFLVFTPRQAPVQIKPIGHFAATWIGISTDIKWLGTGLFGRMGGRGW